MLLELTNDDLKQLHIDIKRFLENDLAKGFSKINFKDYSSIIDTLKEQYPTLIFEATDFGINADKKEN